MKWMIPLLLLSALLVGCTADQSEDCTALGGNWLEEHNECESISEEECTALGGSYEDCASACRHDPDAEFCTMQCVQVCSF